MKRQGIVAALVAAILFGISTPLSKSLLGVTDPIVLAALLYLGSGLGLFAFRRVTRAAAVTLPKDDWPWLLGAIGCGGVLAPVALLTGLAGLRGSDTSLLLNAEPVFTALLAWFVFKENVDRRIALGMATIVAGAVVLSWPADGATIGAFLPSMFVVGACLLWAADNNLTRRVSATNAGWLAMVKGLVAGTTNALVALFVGAPLPTSSAIRAALVVGFLCYGVSLAQFVVALRLLGTARAGAYYSIAPFVGAAVSVPLLSEPITWQLATGGVLMALGVWLHLTETHDHAHTHEPIVHSHQHDHADGHHDHHHDGDVSVPHTHHHEHSQVTHSHSHYPDLHHRHTH